ncbi:Hypothetical predicted protein, partial [Marmota monax]
RWQTDATAEIDTGRCLYIGLQALHTRPDHRTTSDRPETVRATPKTECLRKPEPGVI